MTFSEKAVVTIITICFLFLLVILIGWLLGREEAAYFAGVFGTVIAGSFIIFEKKEENQNKIKLAKLERYDLHEYKSMVEEEKSENMKI